MKRRLDTLEFTAEKNEKKRDAEKKQLKEEKIEKIEKDEGKGGSHEDENENENGEVPFYTQYDWNQEDANGEIDDDFGSESATMREPEEGEKREVKGTVAEAEAEEEEKQKRQNLSFRWKPWVSRSGELQALLHQMRQGLERMSQFSTLVHTVSKSLPQEPEGTISFLQRGCMEQITQELLHSGRRWLKSQVWEPFESEDWFFFEVESFCPQSEDWIRELWPQRVECFSDPDCFEVSFSRILKILAKGKVGKKVANTRFAAVLFLYLADFDLTWEQNLNMSSVSSQICFDHKPLVEACARRCLKQLFAVAQRA